MRGPGKRGRKPEPQQGEYCACTCQVEIFFRNFRLQSKIILFDCKLSPFLEAYTGVYKVPVARGHQPGPAQPQEHPDTVGRHHIAEGVIRRGIIDGRDLTGKQIYLRSSERHYRYCGHFVL